MTAIWYTVKGQKSKPVEFEELELLFLKGKIDQDSWLWKEGMPKWEQLKNIGELNRFHKQPPPPLPEIPRITPLENPKASPARRLFARTFDVWIISLPLVFFTSMALSLLFPAYQALIEKPGFPQLFAILCLPLTLIVDSVVFKAFRNTPGKALLGLTVVNANGTGLSFKQHILRNLDVWISGFALGIPLLSQGVFILQYSKLKKGQPTTYDETENRSVRATSCSWIKTIFFMVLAVCLLLINGIIESTNKMSARPSQISAQTSAQTNMARSTPTRWKNPITDLAITIPPDWALDTRLDDKKDILYKFDYYNQSMTAVLGMDQVKDLAFANYLRAFVQSNKNAMKFSDAGINMVINGNNYWKGVGSLDGLNGSRLTVEIIQIGPRFWRVVTAESNPTRSSWAAAKYMSRTLWESVR